MFVGLRRSERLREKLFPRYYLEYKTYMRQLSLLTKSFITPNWIDVTLSPYNFYKIRINKMIDIMKAYTKSISLILYCLPYQSGLKLMKQIYKKIFDWRLDIQRLVTIGDIEHDDKNIEKLVKYFDNFRKYYKVYRYNNWGSIINDKYIIDEYIIDKIDEYL
jgi:hypothetical protein